MKKTTSWDEESVVGHYQQKVILPNLTRLIAPKNGEIILDIGCGEGYFSKKFARDGAQVIGVDNSKKLIEIAKKTAAGNEEYHAWSADELHSLNNNFFDKATIILAIQNMDKAHSVLKECYRVLKPSGRLYIVMNHPAFRVPKASDWGWDPAPNQGVDTGQVNGTRYRRVDRYLSESKEKIQMHPGDAPDNYTVSFHRPLQFYFKLLKNAGFAVANLEEWISDKKSGAGPRAKAEDQSRKEIPLFLFLEAIKL